MSEPKFTLAQIMKSMRDQPTTPEQDLALVEFLELSDAEQKSLIFTALVQQGALLNWIRARLA